MAAEVLVALPFGVLVGLLLGMLGAGGSIVAVPVLVYLLRQPPHAATSEALLIVGTSAAIGSLEYARAGQIRVRVALAFGASAAIGAIPGTWVNGRLSSNALLLGFAGLLVVASAVLLRTVPSSRAEKRSWGLAAAAGLGTGFLTGLFGVGGGFLIVPALIAIAGLPMQVAIGTSLVVIALSSAAAFAAHLTMGAIAWTLSAAFLAAGVVGTFGGRRIGQLLAPSALRRVFAITLAVVAVAVGTSASLQFLGT
jgi:uncharacterized protein